MFSDYELKRWLAANYPDLRFKRWSNGSWSIMQIAEQTELIEMSPEWAYDGVGYKVYGECEVFTVKNRFIGGWVCDEIIKRDPRLWRNEGNLYNESFALSVEAKLNKEARDSTWRKSGEKAWDVIKRNENLMNRISRHMENGNYNAAANEVSLESLYKRATIENPKEMRSKDFWTSKNIGE